MCCSLISLILSLAFMLCKIDRSFNFTCKLVVHSFLLFFYSAHFMFVLAHISTFLHAPEYTTKAERSLLIPWKVQIIACPIVALGDPETEQRQGNTVLYRMHTKPRDISGFVVNDEL